MSARDSILSMANATITVRRTVAGTLVNGISTPGAQSTFTTTAVVQPAYNINRVVGGADLHALVDNQKVTDVRIVHTIDQLFTRSPTTAPDVIVGYSGGDWTVIRVEEWPDWDGKSYFKSIISKVTRGAS